MRVLHVFNRHRNGGGSDNAWDATIALSKRKGIDVKTFERDSRQLPAGLSGKVKAFTSGIYAREATRAFEERLDHDRPDIIHTHELYPLITPFVLEIAHRRGVPVVHSVYDFRITCPIATHFDGERVCTQCLDQSALGILKRNCRGALAENVAFALRYEVARHRDMFRRCVTQFIVMTPFTGDWLVRQAGIEPDRICVNECVIPAPRPPVDPAASQRAGFAGRYVTEKGTQVFVEAAAKIGIDAEIAVPAGTATEELERLGAKVTVTQSRDQLIAFYRSCRFVVVPSLWFETFAIVAAEAMAEGVPVIASDIGALRDTVPEGEAGMHFPTGDSGALARLMGQWLEDDALVQRLGKGARNRVEHVFNEDAHFDRLLTAYDRALAKALIAA